jgi:hypothetical protein
VADESREGRPVQDCDAPRPRLVELAAREPPHHEVVRGAADTAGGPPAELLDGLPGLARVKCARRREDELAGELRRAGPRAGDPNSAFRQIAQHSPVLRVAEEANDGARHLGTDSRDVLELLGASALERIEPAELVGQDLCRATANLRMPSA